jgi:hypothetical protein
MMQTVSEKNLSHFAVFVLLYIINELFWFTITHERVA